MADVAYSPNEISRRLPRTHAGRGIRTEYFVGMVVVYKFLLDIAYRFVADAFSYQNFFYDGKTLRTELVSWALLFTLIPFIRRVFNDGSASGNILSLITLLSVIPMISVLSFRPDYDWQYLLLIVTFWSVFYGAWLFFPKITFASFSGLRSEAFYMATIGVLSISVLIYSYINTGFRFHLDLIEVYDIRAEARDYIAPFPLNYFVSFADNILPVLLVYSMHRKRYFISSYLLIVIFLNFSISGTKQLLFIPFLGVAGYLFIRSYLNISRTLAAAIFLTILAIVEGRFLGSITLHGLFTYRVLFIPAELHFSYFSYFQANDFLYFSQSLLRMFTDAKVENIQFLIGEYSIGDFTARANNGLFSDAYMNLGLLGVVIYPVIFAIILRIIDGAVECLPQRIVFVVSVYVAFVLISMTLTAALLTSGLIFLIFLLYSLPRDGVGDVVEPAQPRDAVSTRR